MTINLRRLEVFLSVYDAGSFSAAADRLHVAQSVVSVAIRKLEQELSTSLFHRAGRSIQPTHSGMLLADTAREMVRTLERARREIGVINSLGAGQVSLAAPPMIAQHILPQAIGSFIDKYPGIRLSITQAGAADIKKLVTEERVDIGIIAFPGTDSSLDITPLAYCNVVACVPSENSLSHHQQLTWTDIISQPFIAFPKGYHQRERLDMAVQRLGFEPRIVMEIENVALMAEMVRRGVGVATVIEAAAPRGPGIAIRPITDDSPIRIALCRSQRRRTNKAASALARHLERALNTPSIVNGALP